jgi:hypothetical protein
MSTPLEVRFANSSELGRLKPLPEQGFALLLEAVNRARMLGFPDGNLVLETQRFDDIGRVLVALVCHLHREVSGDSEPAAADCTASPPAIDPHQLGLVLTIRSDAQANLILQPHQGLVVRLDPVSGLPAIPHWDSKCKELRLGSLLVRRFKRRAPHQEQILSAFERAGWPPRIENPLCSRSGWSFDEQLHDAIKRLNRHQVQRLLSFQGDGTGRGVLWQLVR